MNMKGNDRWAAKRIETQHVVRIDVYSLISGVFASLQGLPEQMPLTI